MGKNIDNKEIWVAVKGFDKYEISNTGLIRSLNYNRKGYKKLLKLLPNGKGYLKVWLCSNGKKHTKDVHRLVAEHFVENPNNFGDVNHIDGCKTNNHYQNLEWCSRSKNIKHAYDNGLNSLHLSEAIKHRSRIVLQYTQGGELIAQYTSASEAAKKNRFNQGKISKYCRGENKRKATYKGYIWRYKDE